MDFKDYLIFRDFFKQNLFIIVTILIIIYVLDEDYIKKCWFEFIKYENKNLYSIFFNVETKVHALW